jgi:DNA-binding NarL/FixJ family response regulator
MIDEGWGIVLIGDVVSSRIDATETAEWLRALCDELDGRYESERLAGFSFTQGDEIQGLLRLTADPFLAVLAAGLRDDRRRVRWAIAVGAVARGRGPATQRSGPAFIAGRQRLVHAKAARDGLAVITGDPAADALFDDLAPLLAALIDELTPRQRTIGRLILVDGLRQAEVAELLHVSRATVSVVAGRGKVREIGRLVRALRAILRSAAGDGLANARTSSTAGAA